jgi:hypothetical protein
MIQYSSSAQMPFVCISKDDEIVTSTSLKPLDAKSYIKGLGRAINESTFY